MRIPRPAVLGTIAAIAIALLFLLPPAPLPIAASTAPTEHARPGGIVQVAPAYVPSPGVRSLGPLDPTTIVRVVVGLAPGDLAGMEARFVLGVTPGSPEFRHYLSAQTIADAYGPSASDYARASAYFGDQGLVVRTSPDRWSFTVEGSADAIGTAFGTTFERFSGPSGNFFSHTTPASLPSVLPWSGVLGLGDVAVARPMLLPSGVTRTAVLPAATCTISGSLPPCAVQNAYNVTSMLSGGNNGTGYRIAVVDVYDGSEPQSQLASDLRSFTSAYSLPVGTVHYVYPVPTTQNLNTTSTGWGSEEALDLEWARAMAPGAAIDMTFAPDATTGLYASVDWLVAHQAVDVISLSWGEPDVGAYNTYAGACSSACNASSDGSYSLLHPVLVAAALEGISVFAASGDCGAAFGTNGVATSFPASDPAVIGVGGTDLTLSSGLYSSERGWGGNQSGAHSPGCQNQGGSGGGYSPFPRPAWQSAPGFPATRNVRGVPDISLIGGTPGVSVVIGGFSAAVEGTSVSCPIWAGLTAIADQLRGSALGLITPSLYQLARGASPSTYFHDIKSGNNGYAAGTGWDAVTGIGTPIANQLLPALGGGTGTPTSLFADLKVSPRSGAVPLGVAFSAMSYGATSTITAYDIDFGDGNATWSTDGNASHTYKRSGVFLARSVAFLSNGNSSISPPVAVVVGGGALVVDLTASTTTPSAGAAVMFNASVSGGTPTYRYTYSFGDGTYLEATTKASTSHAYPIAGAYCANVVAWDSAAPPSGGASPRLGLAVGGATLSTCHEGTPVTASISASSIATDLPGDISFPVAPTGGAPPYSVRLVSDDPYVSACSCGLFSVLGPHTVTAFVNDSQSGSTSVSINVTLFPALAATFAATPTDGVGALTVNFSAVATGGNATNVSRTNWTFGDGPTSAADGANTSHNYTGPGLYVAHARLTDGSGWNATGAILIDVRSATDPTALAVSASVLPAGETPYGHPLTFRASATGGAGPYTYRWDLGPGASAFGSFVQQSYPGGFCPNPPTCQLDVYLNVTDAAGATISATMPLAPAVGPAGTALELSDSVGSSGGATPLVVSGIGTTLGMPDPTLTWYFGIGNPLVGSPASYTYLNPGNYTLTATATDAYGDRIVHSHAIAVTGLARILPTISAAAVLAGEVAPAVATLTAVASGGAGGPFTYLWNFGDGGSDTTASTSHTYLTTGNYTATVTATDVIGTPANTSIAVVVWNVTQVLVNALASPTTMAPLALFNLSVGGIPFCTDRSVPSCRGGLGHLQLRPQGSPPSFVGVPIRLNGSGVGFLAVASPGASGTYLYVVTADGPNYTGEAQFSIDVVGGGGGNPTTTHPTDLPVVYIEIAAFGLVAIAVIGGIVLFRRRRRVEPPSP